MSVLQNVLSRCLCDLLPCLPLYTIEYPPRRRRPCRIHDEVEGRISDVSPRDSIAGIREKEYFQDFPCEPDYRGRQKGASEAPYMRHALPRNGSRAEAVGTPARKREEAKRKRRPQT